MKRNCTAIAFVLFCAILASPVWAEKPVEISLWYGAAVTEAGSPPDDWVVYKIVRDKLNIDLKLSAEPSNEGDQDVKVNAAGTANQLPDLFMVRRAPWVTLSSRA